MTQAIEKTTLCDRDLIGGEGTYNNFIQEVNSLGKDYRERIYREFLGIEPPPDFDEYLLK